MKELVMNAKSDNTEIMINEKADEVTEELSESLLSIYEIGLETSMKRSDFVLDCAHLLYCKCHIINQIEVDHIWIPLFG